MNLFKFTKSRVSSEHTSIGIDFGSFNVKLVKLRLSKDSAELLELGIESVGVDTLEVLNKITRSQDVKRLNSSFSGPATLIRYVNFPRMSYSELKQSLKFEAQKHIPFNVSEVNLDACILKNDLSDNKMLVLLAAVKKDSIKQRLKLIEDSGLIANLFDLDSLALINAFNFNYPADGSLKQKAIALLNVGASLSNLNILDEGLPRLSRDLHLGGNNFTQKLSDLLGVETVIAEGLKLKPEQEHLAKITAGIESVLANLASEIRTSFDYYESQCVNSVEKIFLSGGGSLFPGFKDMLANLLGIEVEHWDPLKRIQLAPNIDSQKAKSASGYLAIAVGLALRQGKR